MPSTKELIEAVESLPLEDRVLVVDSLLRTLNQPSPEVDAKWARVAEDRLRELRTHRVEGVPVEEVFAKAMKRLVYWRHRSP